MINEMKLVLVEWHDAFTSDCCWTPLKEIDLDLPPEPVLCYTVGFILYDTDDAITLSMTMSHSDVASLWTIPKGMIKKIKKLGTYKIEREGE